MEALEARLEVLANGMDVLKGGSDATAGKVIAMVTRVGCIASGIMPVNSRIAAIEVSIEAITNELAAMKARAEEIAHSMAVAESKRGVGGKKPHFDTRKLQIETFDGDKLKWRNFSYTLKAFIRREDPALAIVMDDTEMGEKAITPETVVDLGLSTESDAELTWILINCTSGGAKVQVSTHVQPPYRS